jgi:hypothetical protein
MAKFIKFGNWAMQRCLEAASVGDKRRKLVSCMTSAHLGFSSVITDFSAR